VDPSEEWGEDSEGELPASRDLDVRSAERPAGSDLLRSRCDLPEKGLEFDTTRLAEEDGVPECSSCSHQ
jgi:hypothetical protein